MGVVHTVRHSSEVESSGATDLRGVVTLACNCACGQCSIASCPCFPYPSPNQLPERFYRLLDRLSGHFTLHWNSAPFVHKIGLVAHQHDDDVAAALGPHLLNPPYRVQEALPVCSQRGVLRGPAATQNMEHSQEQLPVLQRHQGLSRGVLETS